MPKTQRKSGRRSSQLASTGLPARAGRRATGGRRRQRDVLRDVMLSASQCDTWLTLDELAMLTHYPPASISAQLRHLRKPEFGGYEVKKRQRFAGSILRGEDFGTVWEYRLQRGMATPAPRRRAVRRRSRLALSARGATAQESR